MFGPKIAKREFQAALEAWKGELIRNPGKNQPTRIEFDPVAKYLVEQSEQKPSFLEYEKMYEKETTIDDYQLMHKEEQNVEK